MGYTDLELACDTLIGHNIATNPENFTGHLCECDGKEYTIFVAKGNFSKPSEIDSWISVDKYLPEVGQECLIEIPVCERFNVESGKYKGNGVWVGAWCSERGNGCHYKVSRWMTRL